MSETGRYRRPNNRLSERRVSGERLEELVARAKEDDVEAFREIYEIFGERILNYIYRMTGSREDAQDLTQDTFVLAFRKLATLKENSKVQSWLYRIAQNNVFQKYRSKPPPTESIDEKDAQELSESQAVETPRKDPEQSVLRSELEEKVEEVINSLPQKYRRVFVLSAIHKLSYQEISEIMDRSLASVKSDIHRARVVVRDQIKEYLGDNYGMSNPL